jgi:ABC-2 type transport system permease protein
MSTAQAEALFGRPIRGPSALGGDFRRFWALTWALARLEFRLKFYGSALGYVWQLARPLMLFGVLYLVFTQAFRLGSSVAFYPVVLLMGIVTFMFFAEATNGSVVSMLNRESLVRKIHFPRLVVPLSVVVTAFLNFALNFVAVFVFMLAAGVQLRWSWLELFPLIGLLALFATGVAMVLSAAYPRYRDVQPIWEVAVQMLFYGSPIIYPLEQITPRWLQELLMVNPLTAVIQQLRHALIDPHAASAATAIGGGVRLLIPLGIVVATVGIGFWYFDRQAPRIADEL